MIKGFFYWLADVADWFKWFAWDVRVCDHVPGVWHFRESGMGKILRCKKCGKCLDLI